MHLSNIVLHLYMGTTQRKKTSQQVKIWRKLYGYKQKVGQREYVTKGMLDKYRANKIANGVFIVPFKHRQDILDFLIKHKVDYEMHDVYMK